MTARIRRTEFVQVVRSSIRAPLTVHERRALLDVAMSTDRAAFGRELVEGVGCVRCQAERASGLKIGGYGKTYDSKMERLAGEPLGVVEVVG